MSFNKRLLALMTPVGVSVAGLGLQSPGAGAAAAKLTVGSKTYK